MMLVKKMREKIYAHLSTMAHNAHENNFYFKVDSYVVRNILSSQDRLVRFAHHWSRPDKNLL